jgi:hypothetical protein
VGVGMGWLGSRRDQDSGSGTAIVQGCRVEPMHNTMRARAMTRQQSINATGHGGTVADPGFETRVVLVKKLSHAYRQNYLIRYGKI